MSKVKVGLVQMTCTKDKQENLDKHIKKLIENENDEFEYNFELDYETNYNTTIKNKKIIIKIFDYKISSTHNHQTYLSRIWCQTT